MNQLQLAMLYHDGAYIGGRRRGGREEGRGRRGEVVGQRGGNQSVINP